MEAIRKLLLATFVAIFLSGCAQTTESVNRDGPGTREAVAWYQEILAGDTTAAYARVHPDAAKRVTKAMFDRKAKTMVSRWALENPEVFVTSSQERDDSGVVHVAIRGKRKGRTHRVTDGITLRPSGDAWRIWLTP